MTIPVAVRQAAALSCTADSLAAVAGALREIGLEEEAATVDQLVGDLDACAEAILRKEEKRRRAAEGGELAFDVLVRGLP